MTFNTDCPVSDEEGNEETNLQMEGYCFANRKSKTSDIESMPFDDKNKKKKKRLSPRTHSTPTKSQKNKQRQTTLTLLNRTIQLIYVIWQTRESHIQTETPTIFMLLAK